MRRAAICAWRGLAAAAAAAAGGGGLRSGSASVLAEGALRSLTTGSSLRSAGLSRGCGAWGAAAGRAAGAAARQQQSGAGGAAASSTWRLHSWQQARQASYQHFGGRSRHRSSLLQTPEGRRRSVQIVVVLGAGGAVVWVSSQQEVPYTGRK